MKEREQVRKKITAERKDREDFKLAIERLTRGGERVPLKELEAELLTQHEDACHGRAKAFE